MQKCNQQYIGETKNFYIWTLKHIGNARNCRDNAIGEHFNSPGHSISDMTFTAIEMLNRTDVQYRKTKESWYIEQWNLKYKGLNRKK